MNVVLAKRNTEYNTISTFDGKFKPMSQRVNYAKAYRRSSSTKSNNTDFYKNMPPYLVFNKKSGAYYPYFKFPYENNLRRMQGA